MYKCTLSNGWNQLFTTGMAIDGEEAWFANNTFNGLFRMNLRTREIKFVTVIPNEGIRTPILYSTCYIWAEYVVMIPGNAECLAVYNRKTREVFRYKIVDHLGETVRGFWSSWQESKYIYFVSLRKPVIVRFDADCQELNTFCDWDKAIRNNSYKYQELFWGEVLVDGDLLYMPCMCIPCIFEVDLKKKRSRIIEMDKNIEGILSICKCNEKYYISTTDGEVLEMRFDSKGVILEQVGTITGGSVRSIVIGNEIYFFPKKAKNIYKYSTIEKDMQPCLAEDLHIEETWSPVAKSYHYYHESYYQMVEKINDNMWIFMLADGCLYLLSEGKIKKTEKIFCKQDEIPLCVLESNELNVYIEECYKGNILGNSLSAFLQILENQKEHITTRLPENNGRNIYEYTVDR